MIEDPGFERLPKVAYVVKRFPRFSETFILNEILELERLGVSVTVFSLLTPPDEMRHRLLARLKARVVYLPHPRTMSRWTAHEGIDGAAEQRSVTEFCAQGALPFADLLPGKTPEQAAHLSLQAMTLAMLISIEGIPHMHAHFASNATTVALLASRIGGVPFSFTAHARDIYHTYIDPDTDRRLRRAKISEAAFVATVSEYNRRYLRSIARITDRDKIQRVYNGVCLETFRPARTDARWDFLCVGRLVEKKGLRYLLEACAELRVRGHKPRCLIVGDGPLKADLVLRARILGLQDSVEFGDARPQHAIVKLMRSSHAMVLPAVVAQSGDRDGLPTVLLEALAAGLPVISTQVAGIPEIIDQGVNGHIVASRDTAALADAMAAILLDPIVRQRMGRAGRARAEKDFDLRKNVRTLASHMARAGQDQPWTTDDQEAATNANRVHHG